MLTLGRMHSVKRGGGGEFAPLTAVLTHKLPTSRKTRELAVTTGGKSPDIARTNSPCLLYVSTPIKSEVDRSLC